MALNKTIKSLVILTRVSVGTVINTVSILVTGWYIYLSVFPK